MGITHVMGSVETQTSVVKFLRSASCTIYYLESNGQDCELNQQ